MPRGKRSGIRVEWLIPVILLLAWTEVRLHAAEGARARLGAAGASHQSRRQPREFDLTLSYGEIAVGQTSTKTQTIVALCDTSFCFPIDFGAAVVSGENADDFTLVSDTCSGSTISTGQSCGLTVRFHPLAAGARTANLILDSDAGNAPLVLTLTGGGKVTLAVPPQHQYDYASTPYDDSGKTIRQKGCALTSLSMALAFAGYATDPATLNALLEDNNGYIGSSVAWDPATRAASGGALTFYGQRLDSGDPASQAFLNAALAAGYPVIVGVNLGSGGVPSHFVLVTGYANGDYTINDPGHSDRTTVAAYGDQFQTRGILIPSAGAIPHVAARDRGDFSGLSLSTDDHATVLLTDSQNRRTGADAGAGELAEIPQSAHFTDALEDDLDAGPGPRIGDAVTVFQPAVGNWRAALIGLTPGPFTLRVQAYRSDGTPEPPTSVPGLATAGGPAVLQLQLSVASGTGTSVTKTVTFASTLQDIAACGTLGLIRKASVLKSLTKSIVTAQNARSPAKRAAALKQFLKTVTHDTPSQIPSSTSAVLQQDGAALLAAG